MKIWVFSGVTKYDYLKYMPIIFAMMSQCTKCWYGNIMLNFII
jgi:hypothetical protein